MPATVRLTRGRDIAAACGQLAAAASAPADAPGAARSDGAELAGAEA